MAGKSVSVYLLDAFGDQTPRFFNQNIDSLQLDLQTYVDAMGERLKQANHFTDEYTFDLDEHGTSEILIYGRMYSGYEEDDTSERFSLQRAEIHFTPRFSLPFLKFHSENAPIEGLFRGQIIAARGFVDTRGFHASQVYTDTRAEPAPPLPSDLSARIAIISGPYVHDSLDSVAALNQRLKNEILPDYTIFFGPFAHTTCPLLNGSDCQFTAGELTKNVIDQLTDGLQCVAIPSTEDELALPIMPHPPLDLYRGRASVKGDPCFLKFGGEMRVLATAYEISFAILSQFDGPSKDRMQECIKQVVHQGTACPVLDPSVQVQYLSAMVPPGTPHLICCPTRMRQMTQTIDGTTVVLVPKYMANGTVRGFAVVNVRDNSIEVEWQ